MRMRQQVAGLALAGLVVVGGCAGAMDGRAGKSLYDRLGGQAAIEAVVGDFLGRLAADTRISNEKVKARLAAIHLPSLKTHFINLVCEASGGPCKYSGRDMTMAHTGLNITAREFDLTIEDLVATLHKFQVGEREQQELLGVLGPMKKDIVGM